MKKKLVTHYRHIEKKFTPKRRKLLKEIALIAASIIILGTGALVLWTSTFQLPDLSDFEQQKTDQSTKIYDRTGKILLYDIHGDIKRTVVPFSQISPYLKNATVAIEDSTFYQHGGVKVSSTIRAILADVLIKLHLSNGYTQGGSTITQQVIKNSLLTSDKTITRKLKEWVLAIKLEQVMDKDDILNIYLNENPYGGNIYGVEEASEEYFGVPASDVTLAQAAYLAALPQSPTYYSPFGNNRADLDTRKNLVLQKMLEGGYIDQQQFDQATAEVVTFNQPSENSIKAPHFVFYIQDYLESKYGVDAVENNGYKVITTLDYNMQSQAEQIVKTYALQNEKEYNASNAGLIAIDPKTGQILSMVGSRDYFDTTIDGNYNVTLAERQPGSSFKPFVYAEAFIKGYTPDTVVFDLPTEFSTYCTASSTPIVPVIATTTDAATACYSPVNYDGLFRGPMTLRDALAQSINIPSIKTLYLAGIPDSLSLAKSMGITSLGDPDQYGLTLVLGGGEVSLLQMTSAYGVFANEGVKNPYTGILEIDDKDGNVVEQYQPNPTTVLDKQTALTITDVLDDNVARTPAYGSDSPLYFPDYDVAVKTGTTNDYKDAWIIGYTPTLAVGAWVGNNDDSPMAKQTAHYLVAPMWNEVMQQFLPETPKENFEKPAPTDTSTLKPVLRGIWQGNQTYFVDKNTGLLATDQTPADEKVEKVVQDVHDILYWVDKDNPNGPVPTDPTQDPEFANWEYPVRQWAAQHGYTDQTAAVIPTQTDTSHLSQYIPNVTITAPANDGTVYDPSVPLNVAVTYTTHFPIQKADYYLNNTYLGSSQYSPFNFSFTPLNNNSLGQTNSLSVVLTDSVGNRGTASTTLDINPADLPAPTTADIVATSTDSSDNTATSTGN